MKNLSHHASRKSVRAKIEIDIVRTSQWPKSPGAKNKNVAQGGTLDEIWVFNNGKFVYHCVALEAAGSDSIVEGSDQRIKQGEYWVIQNPGEIGAFRLVQKTKEKAKEMFGNRGLVNIHLGYKPDHITGCIVPGTESKFDEYPSLKKDKTAYYKISGWIKKSGTERVKTFDGMKTYRRSKLYSDVKINILNLF